MKTQLTEQEIRKLAKEEIWIMIGRLMFIFFLIAFVSFIISLGHAVYDSIKDNAYNQGFKAGSINESDYTFALMIESIRDYPCDYSFKIINRTGSFVELRTKECPQYDGTIKFQLPKILNNYSITYVGEKTK